MSEAKQERQKLSFRIAEALDPGDDPYDIDEAYRTIDSMIPLTRKEADEELAELQRDVVAAYEPRKPSFFKQLREAVSATEEMSIQCVVEAAVKNLAQRDALLAACVAALADQEESLSKFREWAGGNLPPAEKAIRLATQLRAAITLCPKGLSLNEGTSEMTEKGAE